MISFRKILLTQKWAIASHSLTYLCRESMSKPSLAAVNVLKSHFSVKSNEPNLRAYLNAIKNVNHITDNELNEILVLLRRDQLVDVDAIEVLKCCSSKHIRQTHVLDSIWTELKSKSASLNLQHYNALLRLYIEKGKVFSSRAIFDEIIGRGMRPSVSTCKLLILGCAPRGDSNGALDIIDGMHRHNIPISEMILNTLILTYAETGDANGMSKTFADMKAKGMRVDRDTLNNLLKGYAKIGDAQRLHVTFDLFKTENVELLNTDILNVITDLDANGHKEKIDKFFQRLFKSIEYRLSAKTFITQSVQDRRYSIVEKLLSNNGDRCPLGILAQHYLAEAVNTSCTADDINRIWHSLETLNITIDSNIEAYFPAALRSSSTSLVRTTLAGMQAQAIPVRDDHFVHLCHLESALGPDAVLDTLRLMIHDFNVRPKCTMIRDTFLPLYGSNKEPRMTLAKLLTLDISISTILTAVITRCILDGRLSDAVDIANMYKNHYFIATQYRPYLIKVIQDTEDVDNFVRFVRILRDDVERLHTASKKSLSTAPTKETFLEQHFFSDAQMDEVQVVGEIIHDAIVSLNGNLNKTEKLLGRLLSEGLQISKNCALKIEQKLKLLDEKYDSSLATLLNQLSASDLKPRAIPKSSHFISPLKLLSSHELITLIELTGSRGKSVAGSKRLLFEAYVRENNVLAAKELVHDSDIGHSKKMYADLISLLINQNDVHQALAYFERAHEHCENFLINRVLVVKMVAMFLLRGYKYDEIKQIMLAKGITNSFVEKKLPSAAISLVQAAGDSGDINLTRELFEHLIRNDYIKANVRTTAPLVNVCLLNGHVIDAFNVFKQIYAEYRCTPLKSDLCCKMIEQDDMKCLERLFDIIADAHGERIALRTLAYAFIEANRIEQATIVLANHILVDEPDFLQRDCDYYYQRGQINMLEGLLKATKNLDYNRTHIYRYLLLHYCKSSQKHQATDLFVEPKTSENIPRDNFVFKIRSLLKLETNDTLSDIEMIENVVAENASVAAETIDNSSSEQQLNNKLHHLMSLDTERTSEAIEIILVGLKSNVEIDAKLMSQYLTKAAEMGDSSFFDELWNYSDVRNLANFSKLYLQAHLNGASPKRYIHKMEQLIENVHSGTDSAQQKRYDEINKFVDIADNLRFLQEHPHVIHEFEAMAIKAAEMKIYAPINVIWMYHFMSESPFIENLWLQHFAPKPEHFQSNAMLRILETGTCHVKLRQFTDFLVTKNRLRDAGCAISACLRIYVDTDCFTEATQCLETLPVPLEFIDQTILFELKQRFEANNKIFPISIDPIQK